MDTHNTAAQQPIRRIVIDDHEQEIVVTPELQTEADAWLEKAKTITVTNAEEYAYCIEHVAAAKMLIKRYEGIFIGTNTTPGPIKTLTASIQQLRQQLAENVGPLETFEKAGKAAASAWWMEDQARIRREDDEKRRLAAAEIETHRLNTAVELERVGKQTGNAELVQQAERIIAAPTPRPAIMPTQPAAPKQKGVSHKVVHKGRVFDKIAFIKAVAARPELAYLLDVNEGALNKFADANKGSNQIDGVQFYEEGGMSVTASRVTTPRQLG